MENKNIVFKCRVCASNKIENFKINHFAFAPKNNSWKSFFCFNCGSVSEYKLYGKQISYTDGSYRNTESLLDIKSDDEKVLPPVNFWSAITFKRWSHIWKILKKSTSIFDKENIKMLDFGGYNGYLPYAINQKHKINSFVADLDSKGLEMAEFLGSKVIDLSKDKINEKNFDLITVVQVLEHLDSPKTQLEELKNNLSDKGAIYVEVPNLYGLPLGDEAHKIAFTLYSLAKLFKDCGLEIKYYGYIETPKESVKFDYYYNNEHENILMIGTLKSNNSENITLPDPNIPNNIKSFKYNLQLSYAKIMVKTITINLFKMVLRYSRTFILFLLFGLAEIISLKLFKTSLINKFLKKNSSK